MRRLDEQAQIVIFERTGFVSYANCGLPYYIGGVIEEESALTLQSPKGFWDRFRIAVKTSHEVFAIHPDSHTVEVRNMLTGEEFVETYDKLILSPGAKPIRPALPGIDSDKIFSLRTVEDTLRIHSYVRAATEQCRRDRRRLHWRRDGGESVRAGAQGDPSAASRPAYEQPGLRHGDPLHTEVREHGIDLRLKADVTGFEEVDGRVVTHVAGDDLSEPIWCCLPLAWHLRAIWRKRRA